MSVVQELRSEVADLKLKGHYQETEVNGTYIRIMELLERQATIIEILGEINPVYLERFEVEAYNP